MAVYQTEYVYLGTDNAIDVVLKEDGVEVPWINSVTRIKAYFLGTVIDSDSAPSVFDWSSGEPGKISMMFGSQSIPEMVYTSIKLQVFSPAKPNGLVWAVPFQIAVESL